MLTEPSVLGPPFRRRTILLGETMSMITQTWNFRTSEEQLLLVFESFRCSTVRFVSKNQNADLIILKIMAELFVGMEPETPARKVFISDPDGDRRTQ